MSDLSSYRQQVADLGKKAVQCEADKNYEEAYHHYHSALKIFMHLIKCKLINLFNPVDEKNDNLKAVYKDKMGQFLDRAEYIKKTALAAPEH